MAKKKVTYEHSHFIKWILILVGIAVFGFLLLKIVNFFISISNYGLIKRPDNMYQTEYSSDKNGYSISYPKDWVTGTSQGVPADIIKSPDGNMNVAVQHLVGDPRFLSRTGITPVMKELKDSYSINKDYTVDLFEGTTWKGLPDLYVTGTFTDKDELWKFEEYAIFFGSEMYNLRANWKNGNDKTVIQPIISSFRINGYDSRDDTASNKALAAVLDLSEVRNFQKDVFENDKSNFSISIDSSPTKEEPYHTVVVVEFFPDHRTTFNRYRVDRENNVFRYDVVSDKWDRL